ncbi:mannose-binding lectin [Mastigocoleus testarum]|nr:CVNH domain-containing protein [Mastigocoleus testarum]
MSIKKKLLLSVGAIIVGSSAILAINPPASAAPSTFQKTCRRSGIVSFRGNAYLQSSCRMINGRYKKSSIRLQGIYNDNGVLRFSGGRESASFQRSCRKIGVRGSTLVASCRKRNGRYRNTSIRLNDIHNRNGRLTY